MILSTVNFLLPVIVALSAVSFFSGSMYYMFSGDKHKNKERGEYLMSLAVVMALLSLGVLLLV